MKVIYSEKRLSMSSSVISAKGESKPDRLFFSISTFFRTSWKTFSSSPEAFRTRRRTSPSEDRSSKITTRMTRWPTIEMWILSFSPSWKRMENSFSPISRARPSVAATFPAVREASEVVSTLSRSPMAAICWPFLSTRKTIFALASIRSREMISLISWNSWSYMTRSGAAMLPYISDLPSVQKGPGHRDLVGIVQVPPDGKPEGDPGDRHLPGLQNPGQIEGRRLPLDVRIGGDDDLPDGPVEPAQEPGHVDFLRSHARSGDSAPHRTWYLPRNSRVRSMTETSEASSTTHRRDGS